MRAEADILILNHFSEIFPSARCQSWNLLLLSHIIAPIPSFPVGNVSSAVWLTFLRSLWGCQHNRRPYLWLEGRLQFLHRRCFSRCDFWRGGTTSMIDSAEKVWVLWNYSVLECQPPLTCKTKPWGIVDLSGDGGKPLLVHMPSNGGRNKHPPLQFLGVHWGMWRFAKLY